MTTKFMGLNTLLVLLLIFCGCGNDILLKSYSTITVSTSGNMTNYAVDAVVKDVSPRSIETADVNCHFSVIPVGMTKQEITNGATVIYEVVENEALCSNSAACIICSATADDILNTCSLACAGTLPANADTDGSIFNIYYSAASELTTDSATPTSGGIRVSAEVFDWPEFDLTSPSVGFTATGCVGAGDMTIQTVSDGATFNSLLFQSVTAPYSYAMAYFITGDGDKTCSFEINASIPMPVNTLSGDDTGTGGIVDNITRGFIATRLEICTDQNDCPEI